MTDKELRRMSRGELLELLLAQMEANEELTRQLEKAQKELADRKIKIETAGSLAEASLLLNGVFLAADAAARQYLENVRILAEKKDESDEKNE